MDGYRRYAIYLAPGGALGEWAGCWLGWDAAAWATRPHPDLPGLPRPAAELTATPRRYGFHATIKPPFALAAGARAGDLHWAMQALALRLSPLVLAGLGLGRMDGRVVALLPEGDCSALGALAATVVESLDAFRAPADAAEIARRRPESLTPRQRAMLDRWGYPFVFEEFRCHLTLTGDLPAAEAAAVEAALAPVLAPLLPRPWTVESLCLFGEAADGCFRLLHRYTLSG